jgi:hemerythrin superfamily protein
MLDQKGDKVDVNKKVDKGDLRKVYRMLHKRIETLTTELKKTRDESPG